MTPAPAESSLISSPIGDGRGDLQSPQTASGAGVVSRVVRVPLERPDDAGWKELVMLAREGAQFANGMIAGWWAEAHGWTHKDTAADSAFVAFKGRLSGDARVAISGEAQGVWRRLRARILRRDQRLPAFASDRALVVRGQYAGGKGGVRVVRTGDGIAIHLRLIGADLGPMHVLPVWSLPLKKDRYLASLLERIASGDYRASKVTLQIDQQRRKLYALIAYDRPVIAHGGRQGASIGPMEPDGSCLARTFGATLDLTRLLWEVREKKAHYQGIVERLRRTMGRGPGWKRAYRRTLPPTYESWADGKLHQISARAIAWLIEHHVSSLRILPMGDGDWPAHRFVSMLRYKAEQHAITVEIGEPDVVTDPATTRAVEAPVKKDLKKAGRVRRAVQTLTTELGGPQS